MIIFADVFSFYNDIMKILIKILLLFITIILQFTAKAQLSVSITGDFEGCAPQILSFGCNVTGAGSEVTYSWSSGNGDVSLLAEPTFSYLTPGHYIISVNVESNGQTATDSQEIVIYNGPTAQFNDSTIIGCVPFQYRFTNLSSPGDTAITRWEWFFGDGTTHVGPNRLHTYTTPGIFTVTLEITDANGCHDMMHSQMLTLSKGPDITISANDAQWCAAPHNVYFSSEISTDVGLGGTYQATWNFGDGATSTDNNPSHTYEQIGNYDVSLTAVDSYGCSNTITENNMVEIGTFSPEFVIPEQACLNASTTFRSDVYDLLCQWDFGDGTPVQQGHDATHTYTQTGNYQVTFTIDPNGTCRQVRIFNVEVVEVQASFRTEPEDLFSCTYPFNVRFISNSVGQNLTYIYNFDDTYMDFNSTAEHTFTQNGRYTPTLTVSSPGGCSSRFTGPEIVVNQPDARLYSSNDGGCTPATVEFHNNSEYTTSSAIVNYFWDFGDGTTTNTTTYSVSHTYNEMGIYHPSVTITDTSGCTATSELQERPLGIMTGIQVSPEDFGVTDAMHNFIPGDTLCPHDNVYLYNSMAGISYNYNFYFAMSSGNKNWVENSNVEYKQYSFHVDTGWNKVGFIVEYQNCRSQASLWDSVYIKPPIAHVAAYSNCSTPFDYSFKVVENLGAQYWEWIIYDTISGDSLFYDPHSTTDSIAFTFQTYGQYACKFTAHNDNSGCEFSNTMLSSIMPPTFTWTISSDTLCLENRLTAYVINAPGFYEVAFDWENSGAPYDELEWIPIVGITYSRHFFEHGGDYDVIVHARLAGGCIYTFSKHLYVIDPLSTITPDNSTAGCSPATFDFDVSMEAHDSYYLVEWNFGDGETAQGESAQHTYTNAGTYNVSINIMTMHGCHFSKNYPNRIKVFETPNAEIDFDYNICLGTEQVLTSEVTGSSIWHEWDFGDGTIVLGHNNATNHQYEQAGRYTITHIASLHDNGVAVCSDTATYIDAVNVENIVTATFSLDSLSYNCYPVCPTIHTSVQAEPANTSLQYNWDMGNGNILHLYNPRHLYTEPGTYNINLEIISSGGCSSSYTQTVEISGPYATMSISDTTICAGGTVHFAMTNAVDVENFVWVVGGGYNYYTQEFTHQYGYAPESGYFPITLSLQNGNCTVELTEQVYVYRIIADFSLVDKAGNTITEGSCPPLTGLLTYSGTSAVDERWYVNGDLYPNSSVSWTNTSTTNDILNVVSLAITDSLGCTDSISHQYLVYSIPDIRTNGDTLICKGGDAQISVYGGNSYYWQSPINDSAQHQIVSPNEPTIYYVNAFNEKMCMASSSIMVDLLESFDAGIDEQSFNINIGDTAVAIVVSDMWPIDCYISPAEYAYAKKCDTINLFPIENTNFVLVLKDSLGCNEISFDIFVAVDMKLTLDVPGAFTPQSSGDGNNIVYVRGLGIKQLRQFRIFNRWGEEVFFSDDLHKGWDGTLGGKMQNSDTYSYYVEAEMFDGSIKTKKGNVVLLK